ncbi:MAG: LPS assembly protein LptD [Proteobacteria bacterium]|nr:LPS assembly protein LptD [Pseudomonadota bacterium]MBU1689039.1 LPS assembly protein LptD [Pseudomonadota bacterium]
MKDRARTIPTGFGPGPSGPLWKPTCLFIGGLITMILSCGQAFAADSTLGPWTISADRLTSYTNPERFEAEGDVVISRTDSLTGSGDPLTIKAESVTYYPVDATITARGHVFLEDSGSKVEASTATINLNQRTGSLSNTTIFLVDHELRFSGERVEKIGEASYRFHDGTATACRPHDDHAPDWSIHCSEAKVTIDGMAYLKHATLDIRDVPVLYTPFLALPAKTTRQTGFLFPEFSHSTRNGSGLITPFFIAVSPSSDLTLYPGFFSERGGFTGLEARFIASPSTKGTVIFTTLQDRTEDTLPAGGSNDYRGDGVLRTRQDRYWLGGKMDHGFSERLVMHLDLDFVSDQDYLHEFRDGMAGFEENDQEFRDTFNRGIQEASLNFRESIIQLAGQKDHTSAGIEARYVANGANAPSLAPATHTLPRIKLSHRHPIADLPVSIGWDSEYDLYRQSDDTLIHRLDIFPRLITPLPMGRYLEGAVQGGLHETFYRVEEGDTTTLPGGNGNRNSWELKLTTATTLARDLVFDTEIPTSLTHTFRPGLGYTFIAPGDQNNLPDLDQLDRINPKNNISWQLNNNFLLTETMANASLASRHFGSLKLSQEFDLNEARRDLSIPGDHHRPFTDLDLDLEAYPLSALSFRYQTGLNVYGKGITHYELTGNYRDSNGNRLTIDYTYEKNVSRDLSLATTVRLSKRFSTRYSTTRSLQENHKTGESLSFIYTPQCWEMKLTATEDSEDRRVLLVFSLTGIGKALELNQSGL